MINYILIILAAALLLSLIMFGSGWSLAILALLIISGALLWRLRSYIGNPSVLIAPSAGTVFAEHAPVDDRGELLISYRVYAMLRRRVLVGATAAVVLGVVLLWMHKWIAITAVVLVPSFVIIAAAAAYALLSLLRFVPKGHRVTTLKKLLVADPRRAFARYSPKEPTGVWKMGYVTYKRIFKVTVIVLSILVVLIVAGLIREIYQARVLEAGQLESI